MKMSDMFRQIIALMLANDMDFELNRGSDCYFLSCKDSAGKHVWEIDDGNGVDRTDVIFWDRDYDSFTFALPINYIIASYNEARDFNDRQV